MAETPHFDLVVIGAGPGGYVAAIRAAQLGMRTACVERQYLGGTCLNVGCIPSKALLESSEKYRELQHELAGHGISIPGRPVLDLSAMMKRKDQVVEALTGGIGHLFKKHRIEHIKGQGRLAAPDTVEVTASDGKVTLHTAKRILIATGSVPTELPGLAFDGKHILSSTEALALSEVPGKLVIVGGGYIGVEMGSVWSRLGAEVLVVEFLDRILPFSDQEMALALQRLLEKQGLKFRFKTGAEKAQFKDGTVHLTLKSGEQTTVEQADKVLVCVGRSPATKNLGLEEVGVPVDAKGFVRVNQNFETEVDGIYAIGDAIGGIMLAHKAEEEGIAAVELMAGRHGHVNYHACPSVVYTHPELAQVGLTEEEARRKGQIKIGKFPFVANGRARGMGQTEGFVKVIGDAKTDRLLGVHVLAAHASDIIAEATLAMEFAASVEDIARAFHAHPTLSEALKEAALAADKRAIHI